MDDVTCILAAIEAGDPHAASQLLPRVYDELRQLAAQKMRQEKPGQTLQATALVHEAYLRLVGKGGGQHWDSRRHFLAAAAEAMRRILVENARRKRSRKRGGDREQQDLDPDELPLAAPGDPLEVLAVHETLDLLGKKAPDTLKSLAMTELTLSGVDPESALAINKLIEDFNKKNGTNIKPSLTGLPVLKKDKQ